MTRKNRNYLDLCMLNPGDIILTAEYTFTSWVIRSAQLMRWLSCRYSHAILVIHPSLFYDANKTGVSFSVKKINPIPYGIEEVSSIPVGDDAAFRLVDGRITVLLDVSNYRQIDVFRFHDYSKHPWLIGTGIDLWVKSASLDYLERYANIMSFISFLPKWFFSKWRKDHETKFKGSFGNASQRRFCSELIVECYKKVKVELFDDGRLPKNTAPIHLAGNSLLKKLPDVVIEDSGTPVTRKDLIESGFWPHYGTIAPTISHCFYELDPARKMLLRAIQIDIARIQDYIEKFGGETPVEMLKNLENAKVGFRRQLSDLRDEWAGQIIERERPIYEAWYSLMQTDER